MNTRMCAALIAVVITTVGCSATESAAPMPGLAERGTTMTTAKVTRQDLTNKVSLTGKVTLNPIFGLVAPLDGQVRYIEVKEPKGTPTKPTRAGAVWASGKPTNIDVPAVTVLLSPTSTAPRPTNPPTR